MSRLGAVFAACCLGTLGLWFWIGGAAQDDKARFHYAFEPGTELRYALSLESEAELVAGVGATTAVSVVGELRIVVASATKDSAELQVSLAKLERASIAVNGVENDSSGLDGATVVVRIDARGRVAIVGFSPDPRREAVGVLRTIIDQLQLELELEEGAAWTGVEGALQGTARFGAIATEVGSDHATVFRRRHVYESLGAFERVAAGEHLDQELEHGSWYRLEKGFIRGLESSERLVVRAQGRELLRSRVSLGLRLRARGPASGPAHLVRAVKPLDEARLTPAMARNHLVELAGDITLDEIVKTATFIGEVGPLPGHRRRFAAALGFLRLHPESLAQLASAFAERSASIHTRAYVLDLLASTNTQASQRALVALLESAPARADAGYHEYIARLGQVMQPGPELTDAGRRIYAASRGTAKEHASATFALGTIAGRLEDPAVAKDLTDLLVRDLRGSDDEATRATLVRALGNAGIADTEEVIVSYSASESARVRRAAASALRRIQTPRAATTLIGLASDEVPSVQRAALRALEQHELSPSRLSELAEADVASENSHFLLSVMRRHQNHMAIAAIAKRMLERSDLTASLRRELRQYAR